MFMLDHDKPVIRKLSRDRYGPLYGLELVKRRENQSI